MLNRFIFIMIWLLSGLSLRAQTDWYRLLSGTIKAGKAYMITDEQLAESVKGEVAEMDRQNTVCASGSKYAQRLRRITKGMKDADNRKKCVNSKWYEQIKPAFFQSFAKNVYL